MCVVKLAVALAAALLLAACGGESREIATVPDVRGVELEAAQGLLLDAGLVHSPVHCPAEAGTYEVVRQRPAPETEVPVGTTVELVLELAHEIGAAPPTGGWPHCQSEGF
jgi:hypothetical protein